MYRLTELHGRADLERFVRSALGPDQLRSLSVQKLTAGQSARANVSTERTFATSPYLKVQGLLEKKDCRSQRSGMKTGSFGHKWVFSFMSRHKTKEIFGVKKSSVSD